jgi:hypothetical protein
VIDRDDPDTETISVHQDWHTVVDRAAQRAGADGGQVGGPDPPHHLEP